MKSRHALLFLLLLLNFSLITSMFSDDIKFQRVLNTEAYNNGIAQDKDGIIWISTEFRGLFSYDGHRLKNVKILNNNSVQMISSIFADNEGLIWFFVQGQGLYCYNKKSGSYKNYKLGEGNFNAAHTIDEDREGLIWVGTADGLNSYDKKNNKFTQYKHNPSNPHSLSNNSVWTVFVDKKGLIWIGTEDGLNCYNKNTNKFYHYKHDSSKPNTISGNYIQTITEDKEGNIWVGTKNTGIDKFDKKTGRFVNYRHNSDNSNSLSHNQIHHIMVDRYNNLWICNEGNVGLDIYNIKTNTFKHYSYNSKNPDTINSNNRLYTYEDYSGNVLLTDSAGGLNKCIRQNNVFKNYIYTPKDSSSISSNNLAKIYEDKKGNIWIGTYRGGLCLYTKEDKFENFNHNSSPFSLPGTSVHSILDASDNKLWLGVKQGFICLFDTNTKQVVKSFQNPYLKLTPEHLTQDNKKPDTLWFAHCFAEGLFKFNTTTGKFTAYKHDPNDKSSVSKELTFGLLQDGDMLWIATGGDGLCKFDKTTEKCTYYKHDQKDKNSISGNTVFESFIDSKGNFWVTTDNGELNKFDKQTGKFTSYGIECGFPSKSARHILEDNHGCLWIGTDFGIVKFDPEKLKVVKWFNIANGLISNQFNRLPCPLKDSMGNFWFAGFGLCKFNPEEASKLESNSHIPPIILLCFKSKEGTYNEDEINKLMSATLAWPDNSFEFSFAALDYMDPEKNQHAYKLEGFDKNWNYVGVNKVGQYSNLNPGKYTLRLKGSNNDGIWNEEGISINITITPPFWMTLWFKGLAGIIILSIMGGVFQLRTRSLRKKEIHMRHLAEAMAQVAHDIRSPLAALNTALKHLKELPEQERVLIRNATRRISDIANNLLGKYKVGGNENIIKAELISSLLDHLISEKRIQLTERSIDIVLNLGNNTHSCFVKLEPEKFKRTISNLINNSSEAIETKGVIQVTLVKESSNDLTIKITDNGKGISEDILLKIKQDKITSTKKEGCGIGISSAIQNIKSWNGNHDIKSKVGEGTTFTIKLPITEEPDWFQSNIAIPSNKHVVVLDDDEAIHNVWEMHFHGYIANKLVTIDHFYEPLSFTEYCKTSRSEHDLFLIDHELINYRETGLDLIEKLDLKSQSILVTSRYEELEIRERIKALGIKIIPKSFAPYIPIFIDTTKEEQPELIFIDDDKTLTDAWKMQASFIKKKIETFNHSEDFKKVMNSYDKNIPIYIDSDLKEQAPGEFFAKLLYERGFHTIYLATGYEKDRFGNMPWIKKIVSKEVPF